MAVSSEKPCSHNKADGKEDFVIKMPLNSPNPFQVLHQKSCSDRSLDIIINVLTAEVSH
jgi:hypothetical protein